MSLASAAMSGTPVTTPALSAHSVIGATSGLKSALSPTIANDVRQALMSPSFDADASSFESHTMTLTWRHPMPPWAFQYLANALTASTLPWNSPGDRGDPTSAITWIVMSPAVTPTSVACNVLLHADVVSAAVVAVDAASVLELRLHAPASRASATRTMAQRDRCICSPYADAPTTDSGRIDPAVIRRSTRVPGQKSSGPWCNVANSS